MTRLQLTCEHIKEQLNVSTVDKELTKEAEFLQDILTWF